MIRTFCDNCGEEITDANDPRPRGLPLLLSLVRQPGKEQVSIPVNLGSAAYIKQHYVSGKDPEHICLNCIIDGLAKLDKRPKAPVDTRVRLEEATYVQLQDRLKYMAAPPPMPMARPNPDPVTPSDATKSFPPHELRD